jgi:D-ribose pyranose/furanose isomerase RbsD
MTDDDERDSMTNDTTETDTAETAEDSGEPRLHVAMIDMSDLMEGAPPEFAEILSRALEEIHVRRAAMEIKEWVTNEIADQVLYCYGDLDGTTEPSMADAALINLMRVAYISDEHMLMHLNDVEHFHGYVLAITMLAEKGPKGMWHLRKIAGLPVPDEMPEGDNVPFAPADAE